MNVRNRSRFALPRRTLLRGGLSGLGVSLALPPLSCVFSHCANAGSAISGPSDLRKALSFRS